MLIDYKTMKRLLAILILVLGMGLQTAVIAEVQWRETNREVQGKTWNDPRTSDGIEIYGKKGTITVVTPKRITVRVYTILGQIVSQATLQPGTFELRLGTRGIYLVRIANTNITQKVAI